MFFIHVQVGMKTLCIDGKKLLRAITHIMVHTHEYLQLLVRMLRSSGRIALLEDTHVILVSD